MARLAGWSLIALGLVVCWVGTADAARRPPRDYCPMSISDPGVQRVLTLKYYQEWRPIAVTDLPKPHQRL